MCGDFLGEGEPSSGQRPQGVLCGGGGRVKATWPEGCTARLHGGIPRDFELPDHLDGTIRGLWRRGRLARQHRSGGGLGVDPVGLAGDVAQAPVRSTRHRIAELARQALGMAVAIAWLPGPAGTRRRVAKLSVEEPDAAEPARPDLWGARVSNDPGPPDRSEVRAELKTTRLRPLSRAVSS